MQGMTRRSVLVELRTIAERSARAAEAGGPEADLLTTYEALRARAASLAQAHGLATPEELADQFPSPRAPDRGLSARVREALVELSGWATGVRRAYETLENEAAGDD